MNRYRKSKDSSEGLVSSGSRSIARVSLLRASIAVALITAFCAMAILLLAAPTRGLLSTVSALCACVWLFVASLTTFVSYANLKYSQVITTRAVKLTMLALIASVPIPAVLLVMSIGKATAGDVAVIVLTTSLAYLYASRSLPE